MRFITLASCLFIFLFSCSDNKKLALRGPEILMDNIRADDITVMENGGLYGITNNNTIFAYIGAREYYFNQALGDGPGEISHVTLMDSCMDDIYVYDSGNGRFSVYAPDRGFTGTIPANGSIIHFSVFHDKIRCIKEGVSGNTPDSTIQTVKSKKDSPALIHESNQYIMLGYEKPLPKIEIRNKDNGHVRNIRLKNKPRLFTDLTADEYSGLIFAAVFDISAENGTMPQIRILNMSGTEIARLALPLQKENTAPLKITVDKKNHMLYAADGSNIYRIDYKTLLTE